VGHLLTIGSLHGGLQPLQWEPRRILAEQQALVALQSLGLALRDSGFVNNPDHSKDDSDLAAFALGRPLHHQTAQGLVGGAGPLAALIGSGAADIDDDGEVSLRFEVLSGAGALAILPRAGIGGERVYAGPDSWILFTHVWRFGLGGERALELGTGTGLVTGLLAQRYRGVVATDITDDAVATAMLSSHLLEPAVRARLAILRADVGDSLRPASFDLVTANAPWVPTAAAHGNVFADGGPTGTELPLRFLAEGIRLLRPTGTLVLMCADLRFNDGRAPLHDALSRLRSEGFTTEIIATPKEYPFTFEDEQETSSLTGLRSAQHVTVVVYRQEQLRLRDQPDD
jgi:SAM-dependent methyltransferase